MKSYLFLVMIIWANTRYRTGVFTTEKKAKKFLCDEAKDMKIMVHAIDDGNDNHFVKDPLLSHINLKKSITEINRQLGKLMAGNDPGYKIIITEFNANEPIQIK